MSVIDGGLRFSQCHPMVTHDEIMAELLARLNSGKLKGVDVARLLKIPPARITEMKKGTRRIQQDEMVTLAEFFGMGDVIQDDSNVVWVPVIGIAAAGSWREAINVPAYSVPRLKVKGVNQAFAVEVHGDSMDLVLPERSWAVIDPDQKRLMDRRVYLIQNGGGETTIKRFRDNPARFEPASSNPEHNVIHVGEHEIAIIGRVVSFTSDDGL